MRSDVCRRSVFATSALMLGFVFAAVLPSAATAQQPTQAQSSAIRSACRADYQAHCATVPAGGSAALACLQQNAATVSAPCQQALAAVGGSSPPAAQSAAPQASPAPPPTSTPAPAAVPAPSFTPRQQALLLRQACAHDYQSLCRGVPLGAGRAIGCLYSHMHYLTPTCRKALASARQGR